MDDAVIRARQILQNITPLSFDCGRVCGGACCEPDEDHQGGMLLFPSEESAYAGCPGFSVTKTALGLLLTCEGTCERENRPLACRMFPLLPKLEQGKVKTVMDGRAWAVCPLMESGKAGLQQEFVRAVRHAGEILYQDPRQARFLTSIHEFIAQFQVRSL